MSYTQKSCEMSPRKTSVYSDEVNEVPYSGQMQSNSSDFVVDIKNFPACLSGKEHRKTPTSRIIRIFSRKGSIRGCDNTRNLSQNSLESQTVGSSHSLKAPIALVAVENHVASDHNHHVTIIATDSETRFLHPSRQTSGTRRPKPTFSVDPRKVLFLFATVSSLGSLILIYFTLAIKKMNEEADALTLQ